MAGWLSSKLKEAEHFLHQIDQQAAESLGKPEKQKSDILSEETENSAHTSSKHSNQKDIRKQVLSGGKLDLGSKAPNSTFSQLAKKPTNGSNGTVKSEKRQVKTIKGHPLGLSGNNLHRDDWTELLSSPNIDSIQSSPALASSVGSSDSGRAGFIKGTSSKHASTAGKNGGRYLSSKIKASTNLDITNKPTPSRRFRDETLRRRLELDLDGDVENEKMAAVKDETSGDQVAANGHGTLNKNSATLRLPNGGGHSHTFRSDMEQNGARSNIVETVTAGQDVDEHEKDLEKVLDRPTSLTSKFAVEVEETVPNLSTVNESKNELLKLDLNSEGPSGEVSEIKEQSDLIVETLEENAGNRDNSSRSRDNSYQQRNISYNQQSYQNDEDRQLVPETVIAALPENRMLPSSFESEDDGYETDSMTESDSDRDTESEDDEIERRKSAHKKRIAQRKELAAIRAAAAQGAIREREAFVQKLEENLAAVQRILAEREEQQDREAAELRLSIVELLQALEVEKRSHNSTRMEAMTRESQLENQNADLAKSLGALQWELEEQMSQLLKTRSMVEAKEANKAELERRLDRIRSERNHAQRNKDLKSDANVNSEDCTFEEEQSELWKGIQQCQIQVKDLEVKIHGLRDTIHVPTQVELEFESHLAQLTDHLIQKQAQVEALSTEKATLLIRLEAVSKAIEVEKLVAQTSSSKGFKKNFNWDTCYDDMEYGNSSSYDPKTKTFSYDHGESSATYSNMSTSSPSPLLRQLNAVFSAGLFYLRRHRWAQAFAVVYIISLHVWVLFVVFMNPKPSQAFESQELGLLKSVSELKSGSNVSNLI